MHMEQNNPQVKRERSWIGSPSHESEVANGFKKLTPEKCLFKGWEPVVGSCSFLSGRRSQDVLYKYFKF